MPMPSADPLQRFRAQARELMLRKQWRLAEPVIRNVLSLAPNDAHATWELASCLLQLHKLDEGLQAARRAVLLNPDSSGVHLTLALMHSARNEAEQGVAPAKEALRLKPDNASAYSTLAILLCGLSRWQEALDWADRGLALEPTS